jgi:hypothetical protein
MRKISTVATNGNEILKEPKLTISHYCILDEAGKVILEHHYRRRESTRSSVGSRGVASHWKLERILPG